MRGKLLLSLTLLALLTGGVGAQDNKTYEITVKAGEHGYKDVPVVVPLSVPKWAGDRNMVQVVRVNGDGTHTGQFTSPGLTTEHIKATGEGLERRDLHFILSALKAGDSATFRVTVKKNQAVWTPRNFFWKDTRGLHADLFFGDALDSKDPATPFVRYMYQALDESSKDTRDLTYKVFHHLYNPEGTRVVTNGGPKGLFPHHRGIYFAFNKVSYDGGKKKADVWHCTGDAYQSHDGFVSKEEGPVLGRHRVLVGWHGPKKETFAQEERELTVYKVPGGTLVEFASRLKTKVGPVKLDGDPQHAGFQFRAANEVAEKTAKQTYYVRPDGVGKPDETRNWEPKPKDPNNNLRTVNLPWDALCFVLDGKRYTVAYLNHPMNPKESRWSERNYGRFGCYFEYDLTDDRPLRVDYRLWLQDGEMTVPQVARHHTNFATPPSVTVK
jgi:hypothetical protein